MVSVLAKIVVLVMGLSLSPAGFAEGESITKTPPRLRLKISTNNLRMTFQRFGKGPVGTFSYGKIENGRYYPMQTSSMTHLGSTSCSGLLNTAQEFTLTALAKRNYIDQEMFEFLKHSEDYINPEQAAFMKVIALISKEEFEANKQMILESQLMFGPQPDVLIEGLVPVTLATLQLSNGFTYEHDGLKPAPIPWTKDRDFASQVERVMGDTGAHVDFEVGRALQVMPGYIDFLLDAAMVTIAHELGTHRRPFDSVRVFMHSFKPANTAMYIKSLPTLQVVAKDGKNPNNVVLMTTLKGLYSPERPWSFMGVIQEILAVNPRLKVTDAWSIYMTAWATMRTDMDYIDRDGRLSRSPIVWRPSSELFSNAIYREMIRRGITVAAEQNKIANIIIQKGGVNENRQYGAEFVDASAADPMLHREVSKRANSMHISNLSPEESGKDPDYEVRVLLGSVLRFYSMLDTNDSAWAMARLKEAIFAVSSSDPLVRKKLELLQPHDKEERRWQRDWRMAVERGQSILNFEQTTVGTYYFTFAELNRLRSICADLFEQLASKPSINQGYFFKKGNLERPLGI